MVPLLIEALRSSSRVHTGPFYQVSCCISNKQKYLIYNGYCVICTSVNVFQQVTGFVVLQGKLCLTVSYTDWSCQNYFIGRLLENVAKFSDFEKETEALKKKLEAEKSNSSEFANLVRRLKRKLLLVSKVSIIVLNSQVFLDEVRTMLKTIISTIGKNLVRGFVFLNYLSHGD